MKDCKKIRKLTRRANLQYLYVGYKIKSVYLDIEMKYKTFKSYCNAFRTVNSIELDKKVKRLKGINI